MWTIYLAMAVINPIAIIMTRRTIRTSDHPEEDAASPHQRGSGNGSRPDGGKDLRKPTPDTRP